MFNKCKVTVVKRKIEQELIDKYLAKPEKMVMCDKMDDGQEFVINSPYDMPEGICASAWADIRRRHVFPDSR